VCVSVRGALVYVVGKNARAYYCILLYNCLQVTTATTTPQTTTAPLPLATTL
jgi:hypothetical protein